MHKWEIEKNRKINDFFKTLKVLMLFFCVTPLFQTYFSAKNATTYYINASLIIAFLFIIMAILLLWFIINYNFKHSKWANNIEILVLYLICVIAIIVSSGYTSYYKFLFIFMIIVYTMDRGKKVGLIIAGAASLSILVIDLCAYNMPNSNTYFQADIIMSSTFFVIVWVISFYLKIEDEHITDLKDYANRDGLTDVFNHRFLQVTMDNLFSEDPEAMHPISFVMIDIDDFKTYNDIFGHQQGDEVLKQISQIIVASSRKEDFIARYGGEEFAIIIKDIDEKSTAEISNRIREIIENTYFHGQEMLPNHNLTVSVGISCRKGKTDTKAELIERADNALYRAKFFKKNRVEVYSSVFDSLGHMRTKDQEIMMSIKSLLTIINSRDQYTSKHTDRVVHYCSIYAESQKLSDDDKIKLIFCAYLHDVGKINISKETLMSDKRLTDEQWEEIKRHPSDGAEIIRQMNDLDDVAEIVCEHHERFDGTGYPNGLKDEQIHPLTKILTVADSFDAMTAKRPYQKARQHDEAFAEIRRCEGTQFDPDVAEKFIKSISECYE